MSALIKALTILANETSEFSTKKEVIKDLKKMVEDKGYKNTSIGGDNILFVQLDRGPRVDSGGGSYGDDWLEDYKVDALRDEYYQKNKNKIRDIKKALDTFSFKEKYKNAKVKGYMFDVQYSEKGSFDIVISI